MTNSEPSDTDLVARVHAELRKIADRQMAGERKNHTLQATALVNEAWMALKDRLGDVDEAPGRFYLAAAESMRRILIDHARRHGAQKRGGKIAKLSLDVVEVAQSANLDEVLALDEAIHGLAEVSERAATVVRLRFFSGLEELEVARAMEISDRTVRREWAFARAWLFRQLTGEGEDEPT